MVFGPNNRDIVGAISASQDTQFKTVNNLLSLQDNHVEEFFQYHGHKFLMTFEKLMEDVTERVVSEMLSKLEFVQDSTTGKMTVHPDCLREYERITKENIQLDINAIVNSAIDTEVVMQRKMAKQQYLESQGFSSNMGGGAPAQPTAGMAIAGVTGHTQQYQQMQGAVNNGSGYPVPPSGTDGYGRPYWVDPNTGQTSYEPPSSGLHLGSAIQKAAAWGKWLM
tara:strand:- start:454 stop:1122 length:669 start_codon:yes stop_codon:yes gene_type:complete